MPNQQRVGSQAMKHADTARRMSEKEVLSHKIAKQRVDQNDEKQRKSERTTRRRCSPESLHE